MFRVRSIILDKKVPVQYQYTCTVRISSTCIRVHVFEYILDHTGSNLSGAVLSRASRFRKTNSVTLEFGTKRMTFLSTPSDTFLSTLKLVIIRYSAVWDCHWKIDSVFNGSKVSEISIRIIIRIIIRIRGYNLLLWTSAPFRV